MIEELIRQVEGKTLEFKETFEALIESCIRLLLMPAPQMERSL